MPKYRPSPEEESLYSGPVKPPMGAKGAPAGKPGATAQDAETMPGAKPGEEAEPESTDEEIGQEAHSAVIDNKVLMGPDGVEPKEGDEIVLKVVKNFGEESEVAYAPKPKPGAEESSAMMSDSNQELDAMDSKEMM